MPASGLGVAYEAGAPLGAFDLDVEGTVPAGWSAGVNIAAGVLGLLFASLSGGAAAGAAMAARARDPAAGHGPRRTHLSEAAFQEATEATGYVVNMVTEGMLEMTGSVLFASLCSPG